MKNIIFIAPPAAGKGTQSKLVSEAYNIPHISVGSILRQEIALKTDIGKMIEVDIKKGKLIDNNITKKILIDRLTQNDCKNGFILDGFPRNFEQIKYLEEILEKSNQKITHVFLIEISKDLSMKRMIGRLICKECDFNYNILFEDSKPKIKDRCDNCAAILLKREDDSEETFEKRYNIYINETLPMTKYFEDKGNLYLIDGSISKEYTFSQIKNILDDEND